MPVTKDCAACGKDVTRSPSRMPDKRVFCDKECMAEGYITRVNLTCDNCGKDFERVPSQVDKFETHFCTNECMYEYQVGDNAPNWNGGSDKFTTTPEGRAWRNSVFERDNYTCQDCGKSGCYLNAHHIKRRSEYPKLEADVDNGVTLCGG